MIMKKCLFVSIMCCLFLNINLLGQTTNYKAHAVFVYSIAKYSKWPSADGEFIITVLGKSKLFEELVTSAANYNVGGAKVTVLNVEDPSQIGNSKIVIVADSKSSSLSDVLESVTGKPIMIITEREGLYKKGAGVSFFVNDEGKLNFDLNLTEMGKHSISLSQNLTRLASKVI